MTTFLRTVDVKRSLLFRGRKLPLSGESGKSRPRAPTNVVELMKNSFMDRSDNHSAVNGYMRNEARQRRRRIESAVSQQICALSFTRRAYRVLL